MWASSPHLVATVPARHRPQPPTPAAPHPREAGRGERRAVVRTVRTLPARWRVDAQGLSVSGATGSALVAYEAAAAKFRAWRVGAESQVALALRDAPGFVMALVLRAWMLLCSRDPARVQAARPIWAHAASLPVNEREVMHLAAIADVLADDYERDKARLARLLAHYPRDGLALQVVHAFDYLTGETEALHRRAADLLPMWNARLPGYPALLAMQGFGLQECGDFDRAEHLARAALALDAGDARACHVMAHVFEMSGRPREGLRWMAGHAPVWGSGTLVAEHAWWHVALYHLALGEPDEALAVYDVRLRDRDDLATLIDASSLLWRLQLEGRSVGDRWAALAARWAGHVEDRFCSFSDVHAMLAFVGAHDDVHMQGLLRSLERSQRSTGRHADSTRLLGLPACAALCAFGRGDDADAVARLAALPPLAHRLGGSQAQRDVLRLTSRSARQRLAARAPACAGERVLNDEPA